MVEAREMGMVGLGLGHDGAGTHGYARSKHAPRSTIMVLSLTEPPVLVEGGGSAEHLAAVLALDLCATVGMHALVTAEVGELCVGLVAHLAWGNRTQPTRAWLSPFKHCH